MATPYTQTVAVPASTPTPPTPRHRWTPIAQAVPSRIGVALLPPWLLRPSSTNVPCPRTAATGTALAQPPPAHPSLPNPLRPRRPSRRRRRHRSPRAGSSLGRGRCHRVRRSLGSRLDAQTHISPHLPTSPHISRLDAEHRPISPHISPYLEALDAEHNPVYCGVYCGEHARGRVLQPHSTPLQPGPHISPPLPISPHLSPSLPTSPHLSSSLPISPHLSPHLPISPHTSSWVRSPVYPRGALSTPHETVFTPRSRCIHHVAYPPRAHTPLTHAHWALPFECRGAPVV